jgi:hypothetical protein
LDPIDEGYLHKNSGRWMKRLLDPLGEKFRQLSGRVDLILLVFLLLILNVSLAIKLIALIFIYLARPDFKFRLRSGRIPVFYMLMAILASVEYLLNSGRGLNYSLLAGLVIVFWTAGWLITHQLRLAVELDPSGNSEKVLNSFAIFIVINALVSGLQFLRIVLETGSLNPYTYTGMNFKYFDSTGDYIRGVSFDSSTVNMVINGFGLFYFLYRKRYGISFLCCLIAASTTSNLGNLILLLLIF